MEFRVLGPVEIHVGDRSLDMGHARQRAVLAVLLLDLGRVVSPDRIIDRVWGETPPASVRNVLYGYIGRIRAAISAANDSVAVRRGQGGYLLQADPQLVDLYRFRALVAQAKAADNTAGTVLRQALTCWRGQALTGLDSPWLNAMRHTLELERHAAQLDLNDIRLRQGEHTALAAELVSQAAAAPADERLIGQLMLALYRSGRQAEALRWFDQTRRHLADGLGTHPAPDLRELHQQILAADPVLRLAATARGAAAPVPRELPPDVAAFTGRAAELARLDDLLLGPPRTTAAVISAVSGTAGVGKTALAVHWAHHAAAHFRDGQLHVNLRGYDPDQPITATDALAGFLRSLGVPGQDIPHHESDRAARFRSLLAGKQMLIVLDNASNAEQVRPLLPGTPTSAVVVTSRDSMAGLVARDGARRLDLDLLPLNDAVALLRELIGDRASAEPAAATELAGQCARLPLALRVAAELAAARPTSRLADLVTELRDQQSRLDLLHAGDDLRTAVRAVFSWSYAQLTGKAARMFRLLGLHPGPDISLPAAASLASVDYSHARRLLGELARAHLIAEHVPGRYAFHDLLRAYSVAQASEHDSEPERHEAVGRVLDHYLHTAGPASVMLELSRDPVVLAPPRPGGAPERLADHRQALAWFDAEHQVLVAALALAVGAGFDAHAWQLPWAMVPYLRNRGHYQERAATQRTALAAATRLGDTAGQAISNRLLAGACIELRDTAQALAGYARSLVLYQQLGDRLGEAKVHEGLVVIAEDRGHYAEALGHAEQALRLYQAIGDKTAEAGALNNVGWYHALLGDYQPAREFCRRALAVCAEMGHPRYEGHAWDTLGYAEQHIGNLAEAAACYERALAILREFGVRHSEATILTHLGDARYAAGELPKAQKAWQAALVILEDLQHPDADNVRAKLAACSDRT